MNKDEFILEIQKLNINYNEQMLENLELFCEKLLEYNKHTNLTAIKTKEEVYLKHFYDSLTLTKCIDLNRINNLLDIGCGAGFPGIVLKIFFPHLNIVLIDSNNKKTTFCQKMINDLNLQNITVINDRVENYAVSNLNKFDLVTARAVTNLPVLTELSLPLVKVDGLFVAMKGHVTEELENSLEAIHLMGGKLIDNITFFLYQNTNERSLIKVKKNRPTVESELRPYEKIIKKPLQKHSK